ncbi:MAG: TOBE domain-containing protein, partial [Rhodoluna sp.]
PANVLAKTKAKQMTVGVRPEDLVVTKNEGVQVTVSIIEELGADAFLYGSATVEGKEVDFIARVGSKSSLRSGDKVYLKPSGGITHLFDIESGLRLNDDGPKKAAAKPAAAAKKAPAKKPAAKTAAKPAVKKAAPKKK